MFYALSKIFDLAFAPLTWAVVAALVAMGWVVRGRRRRALVALAASIVVLYASSLDDVARSLTRYGEASAPSTVDLAATYDAVIVLGGFAGGEPRDALGEPPYSDAVERLLATYTLLREGRAKNVVVAAGGVKPPYEADVIAEQLVAWGVDRSRIVVDRASRNTHENAVESARIVRERGWTRLVLVTSALHMPRAAGCFKKSGLAFDTMSVDFRSGTPPDATERLLPRAGSLATTTDVLRELAGRVVYRMRGYALTYP